MKDKRQKREEAVFRATLHYNNVKRDPSFYERFPSIEDYLKLFTNSQ